MSDEEYRGLQETLYLLSFPATAREIMDGLREDWSDGEVYNPDVPWDEEENRGLRETLYLSGIPGMKEKMVKGMQAPIEECDDFEW